VSAAEDHESAYAELKIVTARRFQRLREGMPPDEVQRLWEQEGWPILNRLKLASEAQIEEWRKAYHVSNAAERHSHEEGISDANRSDQ
jgi:hypothetical protein